MRVLGLLLLATVAGSAHATNDWPSDFFGTTAVKAEPIYTRGELAGCSMLFAATTKDTAYWRGEVAVVRGAFVLNLFGKPGEKFIAPALRVGVFKPNADGSIGASKAPDFIYAVGSAGSTAKDTVASQPSDEPGYVVASIKLDSAIIGLIADASLGKSITIGYSRGEKGVDQRVDVDLSVTNTDMRNGKFVRERSTQPGSAFEDCFTKLVKELTIPKR